MVLSLLLCFALLLPVSVASASDGTVLGNLVDTMAAGEWARLSGSTGLDANLLTSAGGSIVEFAAEMAYDPTTNVVWFCGASDPEGPKGPLRCIDYNINSDTWTKHDTPQWFQDLACFNSPSGCFHHSYYHNEAVPAARKFYYRGEDSTTLFSYHMDTNVWAQEVSNPLLNFDQCCNALVYFPEMTGSPLLWFGSGEYAQSDNGLGGILKYDTSAQTWSRHFDGLDDRWDYGRIEIFAIHNAVHGHVIFGGGNNIVNTSSLPKIFRLNSDGTVDQLNNTPIDPIAGVNIRTKIVNAVVTHDPVTGDNLVFTKQTGNLSGAADTNWWVFDSLNDVWTEQTTVPGIFQTPYTHSTFKAQAIVAVPLPTYGVVMFVKGVSSSAPHIWIYKHATGTTFETVCALPTTLNCWGFENTNELYYSWASGGAQPLCDADPFLASHPNGHNTGGGGGRQNLGNALAADHEPSNSCNYPVLDTSIKAYGNSSLRFTMPSQGSQGDSGNFGPVFKRYGDTPGSYSFERFGPDGEFWVRFVIRHNREILTENIQQQGGGAFGGIKRLIICGKDCSSNLEETIVDGFQRRIPQMYSDGGAEGYGVQDFVGCPFQGSIQVPNQYLNPPCRPFLADQWQVYQVHVKVGPPTDSTCHHNNGDCNGLVELYLDDEPTPTIQWTKADHRTATGLPQAIVSDLTSGDGYNQLLFTLFSTNKDATQVHPELKMWIDNVVVSTIRVPVLVSENLGDPPMPPASPAIPLPPTSLSIINVP